MQPISNAKLQAAVSAHTTEHIAGKSRTCNNNPVLVHSAQLLVLDNIHHCMKHLHQAAVLALRGEHWSLLQNVSRSLMNTINVLVHALSRFRSDICDANVAAVYGLASRPLYMLADGLIDLLDRYHFDQFPLTSSLQFGSCLDDSNEVGVASVKQVIFLAIHTLYVHQHWEKVLALAWRFDDTTKYVTFLLSF